jgi:hypothetical protein
MAEPAGKSFEDEIAELTAQMNERAARGLAFEYQPCGLEPGPEDDLEDVLADGSGLAAAGGRAALQSPGSIILDIVTDAARKKLTLALLTMQGLLHARPLAAVDELGWFPAVMPEGAVLIVNCSQLQGVVIPPGATLG